MLIPFKATHLPGLSAFVDCRVLMAAPTPIAAGERYRIALELAVPKSGDEGSPPGATVYCVLWYYHGSNTTSYFEGTGDEPPSGYPGRPTVGLVEPDGSTGDWTGFRINGTGTVDIVWQFTTCGVPAGGETLILWKIMKNGATPVESSVIVPGGLYYWKYNHQMSATFSVEPGDVITCAIECLAPVIAFFRAPAGAGNLTHRLEITGGSLS